MSVITIMHGENILIRNDEALSGSEQLVIKGYFVKICGQHAASSLLQYSVIVVGSVSGDLLATSPHVLTLLRNA